MSPTCNLMLLDPVLVRTPWKLRQGKQRAVGAVDVVVEEEPEALTGSSVEKHLGGPPADAVSSCRWEANEACLLW